MRIACFGTIIGAIALASCAVRDAPVRQTDAECPAWVDYPADRSGNEEAAYLGCSNRTNLRRSIVEPQDLTRGRALGPADGNREADAIRNYETGKVRPFPGRAPTPAPSIPTGGTSR